MSPKRYFTLSEANAQIGRLQHAFVGVMQIRTQLKKLYERLDDAGYAPSQDDEDELPEDAPEDIARARAQFYGLVETLREQVDDIHATGCTIKDIETGLVDWPGRHDDREIMLCWQFGEREIGFWHELHDGFDGRRPVSELDEARG